NRLTSVTTSGVISNYLYDTVGNVTNDGLHSYQYDAENRVVSIDGGTTVQYRYDPQNRRVTKIVGGAWTHYIWQGSQVVGEHDANEPYSTTYASKSARVDYIYGGGALIYNRTRTSSTGAWASRFYLSDRLSTRIVLDAGGNVTGRQANLPFGEQFGESGTQEKHHFTSYERDVESGVDYAVNRQYSGGLGVFNRPDPYHGSYTLTDPQSLNRYSYVQNDPTNKVDALGLFGSCPPGFHAENGPFGGSCEPDDPGTDSVNGSRGDDIETERPDIPSPGAEGGEPKTITKHPKYRFRCNKDALSAMDELKRRFTDLADYGNILLGWIRFDDDPIKEGAIIGITTWLTTISAGKEFHVDVTNVAPNGWTFTTQADHVFYPGTIEFSIADLGDGEIEFRVDLQGKTNGVLGTVGYFAGGALIEDATWDHLAKQIKKKICEQ
ncbi:MAG: RHS repeat-associated core domain-containing protein, partial [Blastocatellia bacterium]